MRHTVAVTTNSPATTISVAGLGYVGLSMAVLLSRHHTVRGLDLDAPRIEQLSRGESPIHDEEISRFLATEDLDLTFTTDSEVAHTGADFVIIATPTNYDEATNYFDTSTVEFVMRDVHRLNPDATMVVKSTVPVGYIEDVRRRLGIDNVIFSPEFLQRTRLLRALPRARQPPDHRRRRARPAHRHALQQPVLRLRRLLPAQGHPPAARQLLRRPADADLRDR